MKRTVSLLLTAAIILTLCACGASTKPEPPAAEPSPAAEPTESVSAQASTPTPESAEATAEPIEPASEEAPEASPELGEGVTVDEAPAVEDVSDDIRPEFKEMMDSYEAFFAEYAELMSAALILRGLEYEKTLRVRKKDPQSFLLSPCDVTAHALHSKYLSCPARI